MYVYTHMYVYIHLYIYMYIYILCVCVQRASGVHVDARARRGQVGDIHGAPPLEVAEHFYLSPMCLRRHMTTPGPDVNFAIFQLGRLLMENSRKYTSLSGSLT